MRTKIPQNKNTRWFNSCKGPKCKNWKHIVPTRNFTSVSMKWTYDIGPENLSCRSKNTV